MKRWIPPVVYLLLTAELVVVGLFAVMHDSLDFRIYMLGGHAIRDGPVLYQSQLSAHWYTNTPFSAVLFIPLSELPLTVSRVMWQAASVAAFAWACLTTLKLSGHQPSRVTFAATVSAGLLLRPVWHSLQLGQVNLFLLALILADVRRMSMGKTAGIWIGIATAIKLTPGIFILFFLVTKRTRSAAVACAAFGVSSIAAYIVAPGASRVYWSTTFFDTSRVGATYISNQSPYGAAARIAGGVDHIGGWFNVVTLVAAVSGLAVAALWARKEDWLGAAAVTGATGLLVSPISWGHHWVWIMPALMLLVRNGHRIIAAAVFVLFAIGPMWFTPHHGGPREYGFHGLLTVVANCYLLAGVAFVVYMAIALRAARTPRLDDTIQPPQDEVVSRGVQVPA